MKALVLEKLQWPDLLNQIASYTRTEAGRKLCLTTEPNLSEEQILESWQRITSVAALANQGYLAPVNEVDELDSILRALSVGQQLDGLELRSIYHLLTTVSAIKRFTSDFSDRCHSLDRFHRQMYTLPKLVQEIESAIGPDGEILDTASPALQDIRRKKLSLRKTIESDIKALLTRSDVETYLQDKFFTVRSDRYVMPIRLDGRGRVQGSILDTSDSGQTLYIEPSSIKGHNDKLLDLELSEKLEILQIFRNLSEHAAREKDIIDVNYQLLIELDVLSAQAQLSMKIGGRAVDITQDPGIYLYDARHPLVNSPSGGRVIGNDILLENKNQVLIVSGPNAGGKTVVLKTVGLLHLMAKAGLPLPVEDRSKIFLPKQIYLEMGDAQSIEANLSTFSGHVLGLKPILDSATQGDLVLLDELAVGTEPRTGAAIGQAVLEAIAERGSLGVVTTHFDNLKGLALSDPRFRNGSMEISMKTFKPSYKLILDIPGQSHGIEVAEQMQLHPDVIARAKELRGLSATNMDRVIEDLMAEKEKANEQAQQLEQNRIAMEAQKFRWEEERKALEDSKEKVSERLKSKYQEQIDKLRIDLRSSIDEFKKITRKLSLESAKDLKGRGREAQQQAESSLSKLQGGLDQLSEEYTSRGDIPGVPASIENLKVGSRVYILSIHKEGQVTKVQKSPALVEVSIGLVKLKPAIQELRLLPEKKKPKQTPRKSTKKQSAEQQIGLVLGSGSNRLDLRGHDANRALDKTWKFIDNALLKGETHLVIVHGHGTDILKRTLRTALAKDSPYDLDFRPGTKEEGGDGVTIVQLKT